jgi:hypothetical protein
MEELCLHPIKTLQYFEKRVVDFNGAISPPARHSKSRYNIIATIYLTRREKTTPTKDFSMDTTICFSYSQIITRFGYTRSLMGNWGHRILSITITNLT